MNKNHTPHKRFVGDARAEDLLLLTIPALDKLDSMRHAFTTRKGGQGARRVGAREPAEWSEVADSFGTFVSKIATVNQVHGENIVKVTELNIWDIRNVHADAMITDVPGIVVGVETADCVPVLLFDPVRPAVAAVHAGWRSTVKKIVQKAVHRMYEEFRSEPSRMIAAIGPAIGPECYEVDELVMEPVREAFAFWQDVSSPRENDHWSFDLVQANRLELLQIGLDAKNIHVQGMCTSCRKDLFYSYRGEGRTGRMLSAIMIKP